MRDMIKTPPKGSKYEYLSDMTKLELLVAYKESDDENLKKRIREQLRMRGTSIKELRHLFDH